MRYAIDCSFMAVNRVSGLKTYTANLLNEMARIVNPEDQLVAFYNYFRAPCAVVNVSGVRNRVCRAPRRVLEFCWERFDFPPIDYLTGRLDVYHSVHLTVPAISNHKAVLTVHDLRHQALPELYRPTPEWLASRKRMANKAARVITISHSTRADAIRYLDLDPDKVIVVPNGYDPSFTPAVDEECEPPDHRKPYILFLTSFDPRKNLEGALRSFEIACEQGFRDVELAVAGEITVKHRRLLSNSPYSERIHYLGIVSDAALKRLLQKSLALLFTSLYEGFGLPILEAFAAGTPVIAYDNSCIAEVAGQAAMLVPNDDPGAAAECLVRIASNEQLRATLIQLGKSQCRQYSWARAARSVLDLYAELALN
jgi:glycosyltransferase involved in cell wall biosynthesis